MSSSLGQCGAGPPGAQAARQSSALQLREAQLRGIFDTANEAIVTADESQTIVMVNRAAADIFRCAVDDLLGQPLEHLIPERFRARHRTDVAAFGTREASSRRMSGQREVVGLRADGEEFPVQAAISHAHVDGQRLYTVILRDLTEQRRAASALHSSEQMIAATFGANSVGMAQMDPATRRFLAVNQAFQRLSGYSETELLTLDPDRLIHPDDRMDTAKFQSLLHSDAGYRAEKRLMRKDGALIWIEVSGSVVRAADGQPLRVVGVLQDITARRQAEDALRAREARQSFIVRLNDRLRQLDDPQAIAYEAACLLGEFVGADRVGYAEDAGDGHTMTIGRIHCRQVPRMEGRYRCADHNPAFVAAMRAGLTLVRADIAGDERLTDADKAALAALHIGASVNVPLLRDSQLRAVLFVHASSARHWTPDEVTLFEDVAQRVRADIERARAEAELRAAQTELEVSHADLLRLIAAQDQVQEQERLRVAREIHDETLQSLAAILMEATALRAKGALGRAGAPRSLDRIERLAADTIASTRRIVANLRPFVLDELGLVPALRALAAQFADRAGVACRVDTSALDAADEARLNTALSACLYRVAQEALNNVLKHAAARTARIDLASEAPARLRLTVADDGAGMAHGIETKPRSFGLLGMRERVRAAGGTLRVKSIVGCGTTIDVQVPLPAMADPLHALSARNARG